MPKMLVVPRQISCKSLVLRAKIHEAGCSYAKIPLYKERLWSNLMMNCFCVCQMLNVSTVRGLMGVNIAELQLFENSSVVQSWVSQQNQSDLNTLNLGIINHNPCFGVDRWAVLQYQVKKNKLCRKCLSTVGMYYNSFSPPSQQLHGEIASGNVSAVLCNFSIPDYACSSVSSLTIEITSAHAQSCCVQKEFSVSFLSRLLF